MKTNTYTDKLNRLLATYQIHYQNLRALHWNIKGAHFFELHVKYEELYNRNQIIIDDLAERILTLSVVPYHRMQDYLTHSALDENATIHDGVSGMSYIVNAQNTLLKMERELLQLSDDQEDEGTNALLSDLIREKEKNNWMFAAWLGN